MRLGTQLTLILALFWLTTSAGAAEAPRLRMLNAWHWEGDGQSWFGGFSGLVMSKNGRNMTAITDRGVLIRAKVDRDGDTITDIRVRRAVRLKSSRGKPLVGRILDSEGLAIRPDGSFCISFEFVHRVACYDGPKARARTLPRPDEFRDLPLNGSLEALAIDDQARLYTIPEDRLDEDGRIPVFRWDGTDWTTPFTLPSEGRFLPTGADFGPDGRFYLLERAFRFSAGFRTRVRRWDIVNDLPANETVLLETKQRQFDNLEGISVWEDDRGRTRLTMISDNNFLRVQDTLVVEFAVTE